MKSFLVNLSVEKICRATVTVRVRSTSNRNAADDAIAQLDSRCQETPIVQRLENLAWRNPEYVVMDVAPQEAKLTEPIDL